MNRAGPWSERNAGGFQRTHHADALLAQPGGGIPHTGVEIALRQMHSDQSMDMVPAVDRRECLIGRAVESSPQTACDRVAIRGSDTQVQTLALFFSGRVAERQSGLREADGCGAGNFTVDCSGPTSVRYQAELCLWVGRGLDLAKQYSQQNPGAGHGQEGDAEGFPRCQHGEEGDQ